MPFHSTTIFTLAHLLPLSLAHLPQQKTPFKLAILYNNSIADAHPSFLLEEAILSNTASAWAVLMCSGYSNSGLHRVSRCSVFVLNLLILLEYILLLFVACSFLPLVCVKNVPYCIVISLECIIIHIHSLHIGSIPVCQCIFSAPVMAWCQQATSH